MEEQELNIDYDNILETLINTFGNVLSKDVYITIIESYGGDRKYRQYSLPLFCRMKAASVCIDLLHLHVCILCMRCAAVLPRAESYIYVCILSSPGHNK